MADGYQSSVLVHNQQNGLSSGEGRQIHRTGLIQRFHTQIWCADRDLGKLLQIGDGVSVGGLLNLELPATYADQHGRVAPIGVLAYRQNRENQTGLGSRAPVGERNAQGVIAGDGGGAREGSGGGVQGDALRQTGDRPGTADRIAAVTGLKLGAVGLAHSGLRQGRGDNRNNSRWCVRVSIPGSAAALVGTAGSTAAWVGTAGRTAAWVGAAGRTAAWVGAAGRTASLVGTAGRTTALVGTAGSAAALVSTTGKTDALVGTAGRF